MSDSKATESKEFVSRVIDKKILSQEQGEGAGARVRRSIGRPELRNFDPFLMLDFFKVGLPGGFPDHPHRGFETVTYVLPTSKGGVRHEDFCGHKGTIEAGDLQWMTAGKGIMHAEMPVSEAKCEGLQLWINLSKKDKLCEPAYQELKAKDIPHVDKDGVHAIVIAGEALGAKSAVRTRTPTHYLHFTMDPNTVLEQPIPKFWNAIAFVLEGQAYFGGTDSKSLVTDSHTITFTQPGDGLRVTTKDKPVNFVLVSGQPLNEPIVQHGPFVMNTQKEIMQAFHDFQYGQNGFEKAPGWTSDLRKGLPGHDSDDDDL